MNLKGKAPMKESNTQSQGRSGGGSQDKRIQGAKKGNPTSGGGINRATKR